MLETRQTGDETLQACAETLQPISETPQPSGETLQAQNQRYGMFRLCFPENNGLIGRDSVPL